MQTEKVSIIFQQVLCKKVEKVAGVNTKPFENLTQKSCRNISEAMRATKVADVNSPLGLQGEVV